MLLALCGAARAEKFDPVGWKMVANEDVKVAGEIDVSLAQYLGSVDKVALVVQGSISLTSAQLTWSDKSTTRKKLVKTLDDGQPSTVIDVVRSSSMIEHIVLDASEVSEPSRITVFVRDPDAAEAPTNAPSGWSSSGWVKIGTAKVRRRNLGALWGGQPLWSKLAFVPSKDLDVSGLQIDLVDSTGTAIVTEHGPRLWSAGEAHVVDLSTQVGVGRIWFLAAIHDAAFATVVVYGLPTATTSATKSAASATTASKEVSSLDGWTLLGEDEVDLIEDQIEIDRPKSTWAEVALVVTGDAVDVESLAVHFKGKDDVQRAELGVTFEDGTSRRIEVNGKRRAIEKVQLRYRKHRLDASTRVRVYAR